MDVDNRRAVNYDGSAPERPAHIRLCGGLAWQF